MSGIRFARALVAVSMLAVGSIGAASPLPPPPGGPPATVPRATAAIRVDGALDEALWRDALALELPYETDPGENTPAPVATTCFLAYDDERLYAGCRAVDPSPDEIRARYSDRDAAFDDDFLGLKLDTFNDGRRAFQFFVNPLGVQMDILQDDVNQNEDSSWDVIWDSAGRITDTGYEVEIAIPFTSLRFQRGEREQTWGLDLVRYRPRDRVFRLALNPRERGANCELCRNRRVIGFAGARPGKNLEITPTVTYARTQAVESFPSGGLSKRESELEPGLTARWGFTPNLVLSGTLNPDFSQVEADSARLDVNEQFALFYPERRPFFLEGSDFFDSPISAVYSRTVADPSWGTKVTGKEGPNALGAFLAQDRITNVLLPGAEGSDFTSLDLESRSAALRYRRDLGRSSAVGALVTLRDAGGYSNRVAGVDGVVQPTSADSLRFQFLRSDTEYPDAIRSGYGQPAGTLRDDAFVASYRHAPRDWFAGATYADYGSGFRADLGFVPQVDVRRMEIDGGYKWFGDAKATFQRVRLEANWDRTTNQAGRLLEREVELELSAEAARQTELFVGGGRRTRVFNGASFEQSFAYAYAQTNWTADLEVSLEASYGDRIDSRYAPAPGVARQGRQLDLSPSLRWNAGRHLRVGLAHSFRTLDLDGGELFRAGVTELRVVHQFDVRSFVRLIAQYADVSFDPALSGGEPASRDLFTQLLFSYKVNPQTALYVGYTDERTDVFAGNVAGELTPTARGLFVKLGYAWVP